MPKPVFRNIVALGDSVVWGQGLLKEQKYSSLVAASLDVDPGNIQVLAHSGADIGKDQTDTRDICHGEVPTGIPTIFQMLQQAPAKFPPQALVLVSGGINDVEVSKIINPITTSEEIRQRTTRFCKLHMQALIGAILGKLSDQDSRVVVTNYFPILSKDSVDDAGMDALLQLRGISIQTHFKLKLPGVTRAVLVNQVVDQCLLFWQESNAALKAAVQSVASPQVLFVDNGFKPENALFATHPFLFSPLETDPMEFERKSICAKCEKNLFKLPICLKAATGHPNLSGATAYSRAISRALGA